MRVPIMSDQRQASGVLAAAHALIDWLERVPLALPKLVLRLGVALAFWRSGLTKLPFGNPTTLTLFSEEYRVPILPPELAAQQPQVPVYAPREEGDDALPSAISPAKPASKAAAKGKRR